MVTFSYLNFYLIWSLFLIYHGTICEMYLQYHFPLWYTNDLIVSGSSSKGYPVLPEKLCLSEIPLSVQFDQPRDVPRRSFNISVSSIEMPYHHLKCKEADSCS